MISITILLLLCMSMRMNNAVCCPGQLAGKVNGYPAKWLAGWTGLTGDRSSQGGKGEGGDQGMTTNALEKGEQVCQMLSTATVQYWSKTRSAHLPYIIVVLAPPRILTRILSRILTSLRLSRLSHLSGEVNIPSKIKFWQGISS